MAKRYAKFEELSEMPAGTWKPYGTMGSHHATIVPQGETIVVIGSNEGRVTLRAGDTLGYNCGMIWIVPRPSSYGDPLRRFLAENKIRQSAIEVAQGATLEVGERWYDNHHCPNGRNTNIWVTDGRKTEVSSDELEKPSGYFGGGGHRSCTIEQATYAFCVDSGRYMGGARRVRISRIILWPQADKAVVIEALSQYPPR